MLAVCKHFNPLKSFSYVKKKIGKNTELKHHPFASEPIRLVKSPRSLSVYICYHDLIYKHFWGEGHHGLKDIQIQLIDSVSNMEDLRHREGQ